MPERKIHPIPKMRILLAGHLPPPMGGIAAYYQNLLSSSLEKQVDLRFVVTSSQRRELAASGKASSANLVSAVKDVARFFQAAIRHRPQVTHIATAFGLSFVKHSLCVLIARMMGSKVLLHPHCSMVTLYTERPRWWQRYFRQVIRLTHGVVALSQEWHALRAIVPGCPVYDLPNALNMAPFEPIAAARLEAKPRAYGPVRFLYLGYLGRAKGSYDLLEAARLALAENPRLAFDLVGSELTPGERAGLEAQRSALKIEGPVQIHQPAYKEQKVKFFREADVFLYPSYHEGMPMAVLEAMACALPVVATRVGGLPDLITDGENGLLVQAGHPAQLAQAILRTAADCEARSAMQRKSYQRVCEQYDIEQHAARLVDIYRKTLGAKAQ